MRKSAEVAVMRAALDVFEHEQLVHPALITDYNIVSLLREVVVEGDGVDALTAQYRCAGYDWLRS